MTVDSRLRCLVVLLLQVALPVLAPEPKAVRWHSKPIGPDGPWNAVEVMIGIRQDPIALFPGRRWQTWVITTDYCRLNSSISHCPGGAYQMSKALQHSYAGHSGAQEFMYGSVVEGPDVDMFMDDFDMSFGSGPIPRVSMSLLDSQMVVYPGGARYPLFAGCLSLGAPVANFSLHSSGGQVINSTTIPWYLSNHNITASSSFGMHLGSAVPGSSVTGSLLYGGYDRSRAIGNILGFDGYFTYNTNLRDIGIRVVQGKSPFGFRVKDGLLAAGNSSLEIGLRLHLDPCSPYMTLPKSTCDSIAASLPVTYNPALGLYMWNTNDAKYHDIINSASVLSFTITSQADSLTINIPFQHLNLTLDPPLVMKSAPYLPCHTGGRGMYILGKVFFQDAFLSANWESRRWWLAQAPGPASPSSANPADILPSDRTIYSDNSDWASTWNGVWAELARNHRGGLSANASSTQQSDAENAGLSSGAKVGIGVGAGLVGLALVLGGLFLWRRETRQQRTAVDQGAGIDGLQQQQQQQQSGLELKHGPVEVDGFAQNHLTPSDYHHAPITISTHQPRFTELPGYGEQMYELDHGSSRRRV
ncbi:hypothetical protein CP533_0212 [Ophiocordyceps camponoti-saundersi (nom. inval.)]|nr:hypothetical protein CP533_0212 [Ophiocordyceps camponoti-saundersi (nom. inval.)]